MDEVLSRWPDLTDQPSVIRMLSISQMTAALSGMTCFDRHAVVTLDTVIEAGPLPVGTSAQKAELIAPTQVLQLTAGV
jgi:hypothetical protein